MILTETKLKCVDNSGALIVKSIKIINKTFKKYGSIGDYLIISIKDFDSKNKSLKKKTVYIGLIWTTKKKLKRKDGSFIQTDSNTVLLCNKQKELLSTKILGFVLEELTNHPKYLNKFSDIKFII